MLGCHRFLDAVETLLRMASSEVPIDIAWAETHGQPRAIARRQNCESALFLEPKITSSLCDAVGSEDEKQTRTLTNGKDRHHN